jgi:hypothetical protein
MAGRQAPGRLILPHDAAERLFFASAFGGICVTYRPQPRRPKPPPKTPPIDNTSPTDIGHPLFAKPQPTPDPTKFKIRHPSDNPAYQKIDQLNAAHKLKALRFPAPRSLPEPQLSLADILGASADTVNHLVKQKGQLVFHATGDTGNTRAQGIRTWLRIK